MTSSAPQALLARRLPLLILLLGGLTAFGPLSMDLYLPAFPVLAADLGASHAQVQVALVHVALSRSVAPVHVALVHVAFV